MDIMHVFETCGAGSIPAGDTIYAYSSVELERDPAKVEVGGSNPPRRARSSERGYFYLYLVIHEISKTL